MIKFLNINTNTEHTGYSFDALWKENQSKGYVFWFPKEQSVDIIYSMTICALTEDNKSLKLNFSDNDIFSFITHNNTKTDVDGYIFDTPEFSDQFITKPEKISDKYYAHIINIACRSEQSGEFICKINIDNYGFIKVGADFYEEYEPAYINLSNMGIEIPDTIQKAIYDANVHEDIKDNILINRKFKELLSNYWDIVANKGSYGSLKNSLDWFEWNDALKIKEIWKRDDCGLIRFDDREIMSIFEDKLVDEFNNFVKTTYIALHYSLYEDDSENYDSELNPVLIETVMKWSKNDMQLKLALLAQFFGTFFMPIHMSLLQASIEDKVYTNALKTLYGMTIKREDCVGEFAFIESNIKDDSVFKINNISAQVTESTSFSNFKIYDAKNDVEIIDNVIFGVDSLNNDTQIDKLNYYYTGPGVIIPIRLYFENKYKGDYIKQIHVSYTGLNKDYILKFYDRIYPNNNIYDIRFNFLAKDAIDYVINMTFITASSVTISKSIKFTVDDVENLNLNIYKVKSKDDSKTLTYDDFKDTSSMKYFLTIQQLNSNPEHPYYTQYLPYMDPNNKDYKLYSGIKLTRTVVFKVLYNEDGSIVDQSKFNMLRGMMNRNFLEFAKYNITGDEKKLSYLIYVSKKFYANPPKYIFDDRYKDIVEIIRNDLGFYPQFHKLELMTGDLIDNYTVSQYEAICVAAEINNGSNITDFKYGRIIDDFEWTFINSTTGEIANHPSSSRIPFVAGENNPISSGYYDIIFRYSLKNGINNECKLDSAFRIKNI